MINDSQKPTLTKLLEDCLMRFKDKNNGAYPYEDYTRIADLIKLKKPLKILEAGSGYGLSSIAMALANPQTHIDSLDKNAEVQIIARENAKRFRVDSQISYITTVFHNFLVTTSDQAYDMVFFDGFAPGFTVFLELERVLRSQGVLVCANLKLRGDRRKILERLNDGYYYQNSSLHDDTAIGYKL